MPRGYRCYIAAAVGLVAAIIGSGVWVYNLDNPVAEQTRTEKHNAPSPKVAPQVPAPERIAGALESIEKSENSHQAEQHARRELDADEGQWRWAKWAAWVAGVQATLSAFGIAFVILTLRQGQAGLRAARLALKHASAANVIAKQNAARQLRAYIVIGEPIWRVAKNTIVTVNGERDDWLTFQMPVENGGNTPALKVQTFPVLKIHMPSEHPAFDLTKQEGGMPIGPRGKILAPMAAISRRDLDRLANGESAASYFLQVEYKDTFSDEQRLTQLGVRIHIVKPPEEWFDIEAEPIHAILEFIDWACFMS